MNPRLPIPQPGAQPDAEALSALAATIQARIVEFCRLAREHGLCVGLRETQDAARIADLFLVADFPAFRDGLRALLCQRPDDAPIFDRLFEGYWCPADPTESLRKEPPATERVTRPGSVQVVTVGHAAHADAEGDTHAQTGASGLDVQGQADFSQVPSTDTAILERLCRRIWQRSATRLPRRLSGRMGRRHLHLRGTWRQNLAHGGDPLRLAFRGRRPRKPRLVLLLDVSGSMEMYSLLLLRFAYALQRRFRKVATFVFSTRLADITPALQARRQEDALRAMASLRLGWHGGTRIGECLDRFVGEHAPRLLRKDTVFVVFSDGLDVGEPDRLAEAMLTVRRRVAKVIWLNPLLGIEGYEPIARGMAAALPLVDVFAAAHDLDSLLRLERHFAG